MKLLIDFNLAPSLARKLSTRGIESVHWMSIGEPTAADSEILERARRQGWVVVTRDLDFSDLLALSSQRLPTVIQIRMVDVLNEELVAMILALVESHAEAIQAGCLISVDERGARARLLPLRSPE
ncbi:MAG: DUF5615 family PIN-like protein [Thermoanaerobaculia bacterium]